MDEILSFENKLLLAPMAGVTDYAFRHLCIKEGADYTVSEMISAKALCFKDAKTAVLARLKREEHPIAMQQVSMRDASAKFCRWPLTSTWAVPCTRSFQTAREVH